MHARPFTHHRDPINVVLDALGADARARPDGGYLLRCPAHDDSTPSLSLRRGEDGRALLHCHAGCSAEAVVAKMGLRMVDLFPPGDPGDAARAGTPSSPRRGRPPGSPVAALPVGPPTQRPRRITGHDIETAYVYRDEAGSVVGRVIRLRPKGFRQQRPNGRGGWTYGLDGEHLPLYLSLIHI